MKNVHSVTATVKHPNGNSLHTNAEEKERLKHDEEPCCCTINHTEALYNNGKILNRANKLVTSLSFFHSKWKIGELDIQASHRKSIVH